MVEVILCVLWEYVIKGHVVFYPCLFIFSKQYILFCFIILIIKVYSLVTALFILKTLCYLVKTQLPWGCHAMRKAVLWKGPRCVQCLSYLIPSAQYVMEEASMSGYFNLSTVHIQSQIILHCRDGCSCHVHGEMFCSISGLYLLDTSSLPSSQLWQTKMSLTLLCSFGTKSLPVRNHSFRYILLWPFWVMPRYLSHLSLYPRYSEAKKNNFSLQCHVQIPVLQNLWTY